MAVLRIGIATMAFLICLGEQITASKSLISKEPLNIDYAEGITRVIINVGSYDNPPMPDNTTLVVAVEPLPEVAARIPQAENRYVLTAAIAGLYSCLQLLKLPVACLVYTWIEAIPCAPLVRLLWHCRLSSLDGFLKPSRDQSRA